MRTIQQTAEQLTQQIETGKTTKIQRLRQQIKLWNRTLFQKYQDCSLHGKNQPWEQWLCDNFYILEKEGKLLLSSCNRIFLPENPKTGMPEWYHILEALVTETEEPLNLGTIRTMIGCLEQKRPLTGFELDCLPILLKAGCLHGACLAVERKEEALLSRCIRMITEVDELDLKQLQGCHHLHQLLSRDEEYGNMDLETQRVYRYRLSMIAAKKGISELELAAQYLDSSQHVGIPIWNEYKKLFGPHWNRKCYLPLLWLSPLVFSFLVSIWMGSLWWMFLLYFPFWEICRPLVERFCLWRLPQEPVLRMELHGEIPEEHPVLVVLSTLLPKPHELEELEQRLVQMYRTNPGKGIRFCVLADLKQADIPVLAEDSALIEQCRKMIYRLNQKYQNRFFLVVRRREYSKTGNCYTGWERKRGAIWQLVSAVSGEEENFLCLEGDRSFLSKVEYMMALDADTNLLMYSVSELLAVALHPFHRPVMEGGRVVKGYGMVVPNMAVGLKESLKTKFTRVMCGSGGVSSYGKMAADVYQQLFERSIFSGKGLFHVASFYQACSDFFPSETVLSHDILEGGLLRVKLASDVVLTDGFPKNLPSYLKRMHRWIRGDFQNIPYLFGTIKTRVGKIKNPLDFLSRFQLFDNLRRGISPCISLACLITGWFVSDGFARILWTVGILSVIFPYLVGMVQLLFGRNLLSYSRKYYSNLLPQGLELLFQICYQLLFLPAYAWFSFDAAFRGLFRRLVSHRNMLEWVTAAQAESLGGSWKQQIKNHWLSVVCGLLFLFSSRSYYRLTGLLFLFSVFWAWYSGRETVFHPHHLGKQKTDELINSVASMWNFYRDYTGPQEHYLPPDNVQESPVYRVAHRTSPTNIGFYLLSVLSARDFELIDTAELKQRLTDTISTLEKLKKWNGNLYNWYDTQTLEILQPAFVSTVDSGNLVCSLTAILEGLDDYRLDNDFTDLRQRISALIDQTDLRPFYDDKKQLFFIGYDCSRQEMNASHYDMLMSEARMTSYYAIASGQVPKKHWGMLSRTLTKCNSYTGPVSWTGTMFEYFMPELLLRCAKGSLGSEGLQYCIYCQQKRVPHHIPFGISESGFYSFDENLNYQYKAHGVQKLALKREMDRELVISPYSSYLILPYSFEHAYQNLQRLKQMGAWGKYGHYESVDFTKDRIAARNYAIIKSYMAHHVGMSIVAVNNLLHQGIMQKRFLRNPMMKRAEELLEEKTLENAVIFEGVYKKEVQMKHVREMEHKSEYNQMNPLSPRVKLLSNGELTGIFTDLGAGYLSYQGMDVTRRPIDLLRYPVGILGGVRVGETLLSLTAAPRYPSGVHRVSMEKESISYFAWDRGIQAGCQIRLYASIPCLQIEYGILNQTNQLREGDLLLYLEPALSLFQDDNAHPAFSKLFLTVEYRKDVNLLVVKRRKRKEEQQIVLAIGFKEECHFQYETCREQMMSYPDGLMSLFQKNVWSANPGQGTPDPCIGFCVPFQLDGKEEKRWTLLIGVGSSEQEAIQHIIAARQRKSMKAASFPLLPGSLEGRFTDILLPQILFSVRDNRLIQRAAEENRRDVSDLWQYGISGDIPIVTVELKSLQDREKMAAYLTCFRELRFAGILFDLVFLFGDSQQNELLRQWEEQLNSLYLTNFRQKKGGIFGIPASSLSEESRTVLFAYSCHLSQATGLQTEPPREYHPVFIHPVSHPEKGKENRWENHCYQINQPTSLPWCHILANHQFGTLISNCSLGYTWAINARECKLTPWQNDTMSDNRGERLILRIKDAYYDVIQGAQAIFSPSFAKYNSEIDGISLSVTVFVPARGMKKAITVELFNHSDQTFSYDLAYYTEPVLYVDRSRSNQIQFRWQKDTLICHNPANRSVPSYSALYGKNSSPVCCRGDFFCGDWEKKGLHSSTQSCATLVVSSELRPGKQEKQQFQMVFSSSLKGLFPQIQIEEVFSDLNFRAVEIHTPEPLLDAMANTWLPWQAIGARMLGRTGFYQCGGAYGFRDQLQDSCAAVWQNPSLMKRQILRCCASQFQEGDVLHWWHSLPKSGGGKKGVRTRCSDDLVWLPYAVSEYVNKTGDSSILDIPVPYCTGRQLADNEHEAYLETGISQEKSTVYQHCVRALQHADQVGEHNIPLIGSGDWNDGYQLVGVNGRGESVWLAEFLALTYQKFSKLADSKFSSHCLKRSHNLLEAVDEFCWDGKWYLRAFFDDGTPMGSHKNAECSIDSLAQSFSVFSGMKDQKRIDTALQSAYENLFHSEIGVIQLFHPAFQETAINPGYVRSYPVGVRENGGQYTHGAVWLAIALLESGKIEQGWKLVEALNPALRYRNPDQAVRYRTEPYYLAADIYFNPSAMGRGGWTIYTGAAGWYYRLIIETVFGIQVADGFLSIRPHFPDKWKSAELKLTIQNTVCRLRYNPGKTPSILCDGKPMERVPLDQKPHEIEVSY